MEDKNQDIMNEQDGMTVYEYIVNNAGTCACQMPDLIMKLKRYDTTGQFLASSARFLSAVDRETFEPWIGPLVEAAIEKDKERKYIGSLLEAIWGPDYQERADELRNTDDNFRRIYKRIFESDGF